MLRAVDSLFAQYELVCCSGTYKVVCQSEKGGKVLCCGGLGVP